MALKGTGREGGPERNTASSPRKTRSEIRRLGRSSDFRIAQFTAPSRVRDARSGMTRISQSRSGTCSNCPRLQRRDRNGIAPFSLFFPATTSRRDTQVSHTGNTGMHRADRNNLATRINSGDRTADRTSI